MEIFYSNQIKDDKIILPKEESQHCIKVLRHRMGDEVKVSGGDGNLYRCTIEEASPNAAVLRVIAIEGEFGKHGYYLHIAVAPTKNIDRFEWFLEKGTEMGMDEVTPLLCDHSVRKIFNRERGERVIVAAAKQSLKGFIPSLAPLTPVMEFIESCASFDGDKFIAYCDSELVNSQGVTMARENISEAIRSNRAIVMIGPEGDFSLEEIKCAANAGFLPISLGESRLRTETAALLSIAAFYLHFPTATPE